jgi:hypothetical protein
MEYVKFQTMHFYKHVYATGQQLSTVDPVLDTSVNLYTMTIEVAL